MSKIKPCVNCGAKIRVENSKYTRVWCDSDECFDALTDDWRGDPIFIDVYPPDDFGEHHDLKRSTDWSMAHHIECACGWRVCAWYTGADHRLTALAVTELLVELERLATEALNSHIRAWTEVPSAFSSPRWTGDSTDVGSVMSFARTFSWGHVEDPELSAALAVWELEQLSPLHPDAKCGLLAALTTSARNHEVAR